MHRWYGETKVKKPEKKNKKKKPIDLNSGGVLGFLGVERDDKC
jgi:hypothetical protein